MKQHGLNLNLYYYHIKPSLMKKPAFLLLSLTFVTIISAQKKVQTLNPARIGIFKNGTCFIKREAQVSVSEKSFFIQAPEKVLMGTYWLMVGKESSLRSIVVKTDTFKTEHSARYIADLLKVNINQEILLMGNANFTQVRKLSGKLLDFDEESNMMRVATPNGNIIIASSTDFDWLEINNKARTTMTADSIISVAKVNLIKETPNTWASTISLEKGVQWFPSYLFSVINDKEAKLELKATIANGETEYRNLPVDIIIGSPEMFYGKQLDPVCIDYLNESLDGGRYDNVFQNGLAFNSLNFSTSTSDSRNYNWNDENEKPDKEGQKLEDLYYYQLGIIDLEKNSRVIVPVMSTTVSYTEIYTAELPVNSPSLEGENSVQTFHSYLITNGSTAPFTTGTTLVLNQGGQPLAQTELAYTPVKGSSELQLSKAVDVQVKNEEEETAREKSNVKKTNQAFYEKVTTSGIINITNYKDKKIKIRVTKSIDGVLTAADNNGKTKKVRSTENTTSGTEIFWEVEVSAGAKIQLKYVYYNLK
jgi:hypothetical protein